MAYTSYAPYGGRGGSSPYPSASSDHSRSLSNHYEYIDPNEEMLHSHRPSLARPTLTMDDPDDPDVVHIWFMGTSMSVKFPAYSISEEKATVGQLRKALAEALDTEPRRLRLLYKKKDLKRDSWPLKRYNIKQNSEVTVIKTDSFIDSDRDSNASSGSESGSANQNRRPRPRALSSVRHRSDENLPAQNAPRMSSSLLSPIHAPSPTTDRLPRQSLRSDPPTESSHNRAPSRTRGVSPHPLPTPSPSPMPSYPPADPNSPLGKVQALAKTWNTEWLPLCRKYLAAPPPDKKEREKEHIKLSESIMTHILLKADAIDVDGDETRKFRKALVNEVNETLKRMDGVCRTVG